jgi:hypothetical protein
MQKRNAEPPQPSTTGLCATSDIGTQGHVWSSTSLEIPTQAECKQRMGPHISLMNVPPPTAGWRLSSNAAPHLAHEAPISSNRYIQIYVSSWYQNTAGRQPVAVIIHLAGDRYSSTSLQRNRKVGLIAEIVKSIDHIVDMEQPSRQPIHWILSFTMILLSSLLSLALEPLELARIQLERVLDTIGNHLATRRRDILDKAGIVIIEFFKDSWQIYMGTLTHRQLLWNAVHNFRNAFIGPIE